MIHYICKLMKISMLWSREFNSRTLINFSYYWRAVSISFRRVHPMPDQWHLLCFIYGFCRWPSMLLTPPTPPSSATQLPLTVAFLLSPTPESLPGYFRCSPFYYRLQLLTSHLSHWCWEEATAQAFPRFSIQMAMDEHRLFYNLLHFSIKTQFCVLLCPRRQKQWWRGLFLHRLYLLPSRQNQHWMNSKGEFEAAVDRFENLGIRVGWFQTTWMGSFIQWDGKKKSKYKVNYKKCWRFTISTYHVYNEFIWRMIITKFTFNRYYFLLLFILFIYLQI